MFVDMSIQQHGVISLEIIFDTSRSDLVASWDAETINLGATDPG